MQGPQYGTEAGEEELNEYVRWSLSQHNLTAAQLAAVQSLVQEVCGEARKQGYYEGFATPEAAEAAHYPE